MAEIIAWDSHRVRKQPCNFSPNEDPPMTTENQRRRRLGNQSDPLINRFPATQIKCTEILQVVSCRSVASPRPQANTAFLVCRSVESLSYQEVVVRVFCATVLVSTGEWSRRSARGAESGRVDGLQHCNFSLCGGVIISRGWHVTKRMISCKVNEDLC